jgi:hypothetical protein
MTRKYIAIAVTVLSLAATVLSAVEGWVPPGWGLIVAALIGGIYALVRAGRKVLDGADWKAVWNTTEMVPAIITWLASLAGLVTGVVPAKYAGVASAIAAGLLTISRQLNGQTSPAADVQRCKGMVGAIPVALIKPIADITPIR